MPQNPRAVPLPSRIGTHRSVTYSHVSSSSVRFTHRLPSAGRSTRLAETLSLPGDQRGIQLRIPAVVHLKP